MKRIDNKLIMSLVFMLTVIFSHNFIYGQEDNYVDDLVNTPTDRLAQTGMKFLSVQIDPRGAAMGDAMTAVEQKSNAMFYNPAGMARIDGFDLYLSQTSFIADINYNAGSAAFTTGIGVFGISGVFVNYGDIERVIRADNDAGYLSDGSFAPTASAIGVSYARALTDRFSIGGQAKYVTQNLGENATSYAESDSSLVYTDYSQNVMAYDFGIIYDTGFKGLTLGMGVQNFSREITYAEFGFELPLLFRIGATMNVLNLTNLDPNMHSLLLSVDTARPRDYYEQVKVGFEYTLMNTLNLRAGYIYPEDERGISAGAGVQTSFGDMAGSVDFSYTQFGVFGNVTRFSLGLAF